MPGVIAIKATPFQTYEQAVEEMNKLNALLSDQLDLLAGVVMIIVCDDAVFVAVNLRNFLWVAFTRANPSHDIYGIASFTEHKHWGCSGPLMIDARIKPHHAPPVEKDPAIEKKIDRLFEKGGSLFHIK